MNRHFITPSSAVSRRMRLGSSLNALAMSLALAFAVSPDTTYAQSTAVAQIDIPAQSLHQALLQLGQQTDIQIYYLPGTVANLSAPAVSGPLTAEQALARLLQGTGVDVRWNGTTASLSRPGSSEATELAPVVVAGLDPTTEGTDSYVATGPSSTATGLGLSLRETPQSVSVITRQRMDDQGMVTLTDALKQTTGVKVQESEVFGNSFEVRGFKLDTMQVDGVPVTLGSGLSEPGLDLAIYDRVEVVRGATGLMQGAGNPGGTVNLVRRQPTREFTASASASVASWHRYRLEGDISGPLNERGDLRGRLVAVYEDGDSFIDYVTERREVISGTLQYDFTPDITATLGVDHQRTNGVPQGTGVVFYADGGDIGLPRSTYLGVDWNHRSTRSTTVSGDLSWKLGQGWDVRLAGNRQWYDTDLVFLSASGAGVSRETGMGPLLNYASATHMNRTQTSVDLRASGPVQVLGRSHELVVGANTRTNPTDVDRVPIRGYSHIRPDVRNWDPSALPEPDIGPYETRSSTRTRQTGLYAAARVSLADPLTVILGGRFSWWGYTAESSNLLTGAVTNNTDYKVRGEFTPYAGLVFDLDSNTTLYASYTDVFRPQNAIDSSGSLLKPIVGANYEAGIKRDFREGRVNTSLALFRIEETNRAQADLAGPTPCPFTTSDYCSVAAGKVRSQGVETEVSGELAQGWRFYAGYTYSTTKYMKDAANQGQTFNTRNPEHMFKLFTAYQLPGKLRQWTVGGGVYWQSQFVLDNSASGVRIEQNPYAVADFMLRYDFTPKISATLNVNNMFDKIYYRYISHERAYNYYGEPRSIMLTLRAQY